MNNLSFQALAGFASSAIFIISTFSMLIKAIKTKDLNSYSLANIALSNIGNFIHWIYILSLPFGPIWFLHGFYTAATIMMLIWYFRYGKEQ